MSWQDSYRFFNRYKKVDMLSSLNELKLNEECFIRKGQRCGKIFGASKSCFIASPDYPELKVILALMSEKLMKVGIEPVIAVEKRAYGQDIFCTKICGKIIESKFCMVVLDDLIVNDKNIPNPNVYYEYGLMTTLRKHIIPLQKDSHKLAFNIQSYDTIKYNAENIAPELDKAIKDAIQIVEHREKVGEESFVPDKTILRGFEMSNFELKKENWFLSKVIDDTDFKGFGYNAKEFYVYLGKINGRDDFLTYLEDLNVVIYRTEKIAQGYTQKINELNKSREELERRRVIVEQKDGISPIAKQQSLVSIAHDIRRIEREITEDNQRFLDLINTIYIGFVIDPNIDAKEFIAQARLLSEGHPRFQLVYSDHNEISFKDVKVSLIIARI